MRVVALLARSCRDCPDASLDSSTNEAHIITAYWEASRHLCMSA